VNIHIDIQVYKVAFRQFKMMVCFLQIVLGIIPRAETLRLLSRTIYLEFFRGNMRKTALTKIPKIGIFEEKSLKL